MSLPQEALKTQLANHQPLGKKKFLIGFDGFTDEIIDVVALRKSLQEHEAFPTIQSFGERVLECANKSANIELVVKQTKLGGNAPILCNALLAQGHQGSFIGPIGEPNEIEPLFSEMAAQLEQVVTLGPSAHTDALEFEDGKLMLGKHKALRDIDYRGLLAHSSEKQLIELFSEAILFGNTTWTLLLGLNDLWSGLLENIFPHVPPKDQANQRFMFVDLCDPSKRAISELQEALHLLQKFSAWYDVVLGLNIVEVEKVAGSLGYDKGPCKKEEDYDQALSFIAEKTHFSQIALHTKHFAKVAFEGTIQTTPVSHCEKPKISTGAGDNFNAGYCGGLLLGMTPSACLAMGVLSSGLYVRHGQSPSLEEIKAQA